MSADIAIFFCSVDFTFPRPCHCFFNLADCTAMNWNPHLWALNGPIIPPPHTDWSYHTSTGADWSCHTSSLCWLVLSYLLLVLTGPIIPPPRADWSYHTSSSCWLVLSYLLLVLIGPIIPPPCADWSYHTFHRLQAIMMDRGKQNVSSDSARSHYACVELVYMCGEGMWSM